MRIERGMTARRRIAEAAIVIGVLAALVLAFRLRRPGTTTPEVVLRVASQRGGTKAQMIASGVLEGLPYRIEWSEFPAAQHLLEALGAGAIDVGAVGDAPFLFAYESGSPIQAVQAIRYAPTQTAIVVRASASARSEADLRGLRIATGRGSAGHYMLLRALERAGLGANDVTLVFLAPGDANAAFQSGSVDAWASWNPYVGAAVLHQGARILVDGRGLATGTGFMAAHVSAIAAKRPLLEDFLKRHGRAQVWASTHVDAFADVLAKETGLPRDVARYTADRGQQSPVPIDAALLAEQRDVLAHFAKAGTLRAERALEAGFDGTLFQPEPQPEQEAAGRAP